MALLSPAVIQSIFDAMLPWSAAHPNEGKLVPLDEGDFRLAGYTGIFKKGDIVFVKTKEPVGLRRTAIYVVEDVTEWTGREGFQIFWRLVLLGGSGVPVVALYYQNPYGKNPHVYMDDYFTDYGHGNLPKLNYYVDRVVEGGKTVWDVEDRLRGGR